jgi:excisionase family DNA binding protein
MDKLINIKKAAEILGISTTTLREWCNANKIFSIRTVGGHRRFKIDDLANFCGEKQLDKTENNLTAIYCRVSSHDQKQKGDLDRQKARIFEYCIKNKYQVEYILEEISSGMLDVRPKLNKLFFLIIDKKINRVVIEHKDRLCRFMFKIFEFFFNSYGVVVEIVEETFPKSYEEELTQDMISLMTSFSARIYGRRGAENRRKAKT